MTKFAWMCATEMYQPEELIQQVKLAEAEGFDAVVVPDAFHPWTDEGASTFAWSWLGAAAAVTERIELITTVTAPILRYHPAIIAQAAATLDRLSGGRFILGLGTGHPLHDASLGFGVVGTRERSARLAEAVEIIRRLLSSEQVSFDGAYYRVDGARLASPPSNHVPIWIAAAGPRSAALAGRWGDGIITSVKDIRQTRERVIGPFLAAADSPGFEREGSPSVLTTRWAVIGGDDDEAWRALGSLRGLRLPSRDLVTDPADLRKQADAAGQEEVLAGYARASDAAGAYVLYEDIVRQLHPDYVSIQLATTDPLAALSTIGRQVLPRLRQA